MQKTTVYLDAEAVLKLREMSAAVGKPQAELIREAVDRYTSGFRAPRITGIGKYRSGRADVSEKAEAILEQAFRRRP